MEPVLTPRLDALGLVRACGELAQLDADLARILDQYGYPPFWSREPGFATLLHIISNSRFRWLRRGRRLRNYKTDSAR